MADYNIDTSKLDGLSEEERKKVLSILKDFSKIMNQNVFLISNKLNEIDDKMFDNTLVVTIKDSKSSITEEHTNEILV